jgi:glucosamine-6-phosphate deaminase
MTEAQIAQNVTVVGDYDAMSTMAADAVERLITKKPEAVLSLPTGSTPLGLFGELLARVRAGKVDFSRAHLFCLDEYVGVNREDPNSLTGFLDRSFLHGAGFDPDRVHILPSEAEDLDAAATAYEAKLSDLGGLDLVILGLGPNGHIAYNEPGSAADSRTRVLTLTPQSIEQAEAYWEESVATPHRAITMGVATLLEARAIILIVSGAAKAEMLRRTLKDPMTPDVPASFLQKATDRLTVIADEDAAAEL